jgi:hypothetical protein
MPTLILNEIECVDPGSRRDDMMLTLSSNEVTSRVIWGPEGLRKENRMDLKSRIAPIEYDDLAKISLYEHDSVGRNDYFGTLDLPANPGVGIFDVYFPNALYSRYRLNYSFRPESVSPNRGIIRLCSFTCNDAQEIRDEVTLSVNGRIVLGPRHVMKADWRVDFNDYDIFFRTTCTICLQDTQGRDRNRKLNFTYGSYAKKSDMHHEFHVSGPDGTGKARYTLAYRMLA